MSVGPVEVRWPHTDRERALLHAFRQFSAKKAIAASGKRFISSSTRNSQLKCICGLASQLLHCTRLVQDDSKGPKTSQRILILARYLLQLVSKKCPGVDARYLESLPDLKTLETSPLCFLSCMAVQRIADSIVLSEDETSLRLLAWQDRKENRTFVNRKALRSKGLGVFVPEHRRFDPSHTISSAIHRFAKFVKDHSKWLQKNGLFLEKNCTEFRAPLVFVNYQDYSTDRNLPPSLEFTRLTETPQSCQKRLQDIAKRLGMTLGMS